MLKRSPFVSTRAVCADLIFALSNRPSSPPFHSYICHHHSRKRKRNQISPPPLLFLFLHTVSTSLADHLTIVKLSFFSLPLLSLAHGKGERGEMVILSPGTFTADHCDSGPHKPGEGLGLPPPLVSFRCAEHPLFPFPPLLFPQVTFSLSLLLFEEPYSEGREGRGGGKRK